MFPLGVRTKNSDIQVVVVAVEREATKGEVEQEEEEIITIVRPQAVAFHIVQRRQ